MRCKVCNRRVKDAFENKLNHIVQYHPDRIIVALPMVATISKLFGERIGDKLKGLFTNAKENV